MLCSADLNYTCTMVVKLYYFEICQVREGRMLASPTFTYAKILQSLGYTSRYFYGCTVHFDDSITFIHQLMHLYIYYQSLKHFVHLIAPTCFDTHRVIIRELYFPG
jgi:hypothetical protein